jgi:hypothetical protein
MHCYGNRKYQRRRPKIVDVLSADFILSVIEEQTMMHKIAGKTRVAALLLVV